MKQSLLSTVIASTRDGRRSGAKRSPFRSLSFYTEDCLPVRLGRLRPALKIFRSVLAMTSNKTLIAKHTVIANTSGGKRSGVKQSLLSYRHSEYPRWQEKWREPIPLFTSSRVPAVAREVARSDPPFVDCVSISKIASPRPQNLSLGARNDEQQKRHRKKIPSLRRPVVEREVG